MWDAMCSSIQWIERRAGTVDVIESRYQRHHKRESQHDVIGCDALHSRLRCWPRLVRRTTADRMAARQKSDRRRDDRCAVGSRNRERI